MLPGSNHLARTVKGERVGRRWSAGKLDVAVGAVGVQHCLGVGVASVAMGPGVGDGIDAEENTCQSLWRVREWAETTLMGCMENGRVVMTAGDGGSYMIICCNGNPRLLLVHRLLLVSATANGRALLGHFVEFTQLSKRVGKSAMPCALLKRQG